MELFDTHDCLPIHADLGKLSTWASKALDKIGKPVEIVFRPATIDQKGQVDAHFTEGIYPAPSQASEL